MCILVALHPKFAFLTQIILCWVPSTISWSMGLAFNKLAKMVNVTLVYVKSEP